MSKVNIKVVHITRVEGHGNIVAALDEGRIEEVMFQVVEAIRFFEGILRGRSWEEVGHIATRICGICAVSHCCASLQGTEKALGIEVSAQTELLRRLIMNGEIMSSHALHVYFLAAPDFLRLESVLPLVQEDPETVKRAFHIKQNSYDIGNLLGGRHTHPISLVPGGFTSLPSVSDLERLRERLTGLRCDVEKTVELYARLEIPDLERETEYVCLRRPDYYTFYGGQIVSSDGDALPAERHREATSEFVVGHSTAKHAKWHRESYMVGALARVNNNWKQLRPEAHEAMNTLSLKPPCHNPFMNTVAQVVELVHCLEDSITLLGEILDKGLREEYEPEVTPRAGQGVGAVEAPRGLLIHDYTYNDRGRSTNVNCVIPTAQNLGNLDADMRMLLSELKDKPEEDIRRGLEMLVRAYDPCISCSAH